MPGGLASDRVVVVFVEEMNETARTRTGVRRTLPSESHLRGQDAWVRAAERLTLYGVGA